MTHDIGFFYLVGHGIPEDVTAGAFTVAKQFFALPLKDKQRVEMLRSPHFRGYTRTGGELTQGRVDWREQIDIGADRAPVDDPTAPAYMRLEGPNLWPTAQPELREVSPTGNGAARRSRGGSCSPGRWPSAAPRRPSPRPSATAPPP
ncbi:2-oxoglutarate and iron-dependent oxygenase domain-containing protein [Pseudonocardia halophobica]|uniref:2-oxoglutarate and iron-dependent oxygenase domain-containing protein n=1 Tax=Pseudonocardia halophobica TaxID=29401 RepID=UPI003D8A7DAA